MHDYNSRARSFWWLVAAIGYALLAHALYRVSSLPAASILQIALAAAFVGAVAVFPVEIPGTKMSVAGGEIFIFLALLLFGAEAAVLIAVVEAGIASARTSKRWTSWFGSPAMAAITVSVSGYAFLATRSGLDQRGLLSGAAMLLLLTTFALAYWLLTNWLPSLLLALKQGSRLDLFTMFRERSWMAALHLASAAIAANLFYAGVIIDGWLLAAALPANGILLSSADYVAKRLNNERRPVEIRSR
jgi:hypothetical protein